MDAISVINARYSKSGIAREVADANFANQDRMRIIEWAYILGSGLRPPADASQGNFWNPATDIIDGDLLRDYTPTGNVGDPRPRQDGKCLLFDGSTQYVEIENTDVGAFGTDDFSISVWCYPESFASEPTVVSRGTTSAGQWLLYFLTNSNLRFRSGVDILIDSDSNNANEWVHAVVIRVSGVTSLYVNGIFADSTSNATDISVGGVSTRVASASVPGRFFQGRIFTPKFWRRGLTQTEITQLYFQGKYQDEPLTIPTDKSAGWHLDDNSTTTVLDNSGNGNTGTIINGSVGMLVNDGNVPWSPQNLLGYNGTATFDGVGDYITFENQPAPAYPITLECEVKWDGLGTDNDYCFSLCSSEVNNKYYTIQLFQTQLRVLRRGTPPGTITTDTPWTPTTDWEQITLELISDTEFSIYQNGNLLQNHTGLSPVANDSQFDTFLVGGQRIFPVIGGPFTGPIKNAKYISNGTDRVIAAIGDGKGTTITNSAGTNGVLTTSDVDAFWADKTPQSPLTPDGGGITGRVPRNADLHSSFCGLFSGVEHVEANSIYMPQAGDPFDIELTIIGDPQSGARLWSYGSSGSNLPTIAVYSSGGDPSKVEIIYRDDTTSRTSGVESNAVVLDGTSHTFRVVFDGNIGIEYYVDGELDSSFDMTSPASTITLNRFTVGALGNVTTVSRFTGSIWDVSVNVVSVKRGTFNFSTGNGTTIYDTSGNGNHGTLFNATLPSFWSKTNDTYHRNMIVGFSTYTHATLGDIRVPYSDLGNPLVITPPTGYTLEGENPPGGYNGCETATDFTGGKDEPWAYELYSGALFDGVSGYVRSDVLSVPSYPCSIGATIDGSTGIGAIASFSQDSGTTDFFLLSITGPTSVSVFRRSGGNNHTKIIAVPAITGVVTIRVDFVSDTEFSLFFDDELFANYTGEPSVDFSATTVVFAAGVSRVNSPGTFYSGVLVNSFYIQDGDTAIDWPLLRDALDHSGNGNDGTIIGGVTFPITSLETDYVQGDVRIPPNYKTVVSEKLENQFYTKTETPPPLPVFFYLRPDGVSYYLRPDGSRYRRP